MADKHSSHTHRAPSATAHHKKTSSHRTVVATTTRPATRSATPSSTAAVLPQSHSNVFVVPSNMPVVSDPFFGRPNTAISTPTSIAATTTALPPAAAAAAAEESSNLGAVVVGAVIGGAAGLVAIVIAAIIFIRRRKRRQSDEGRAFQHRYIREDENNDKSSNNNCNPTVQPPRVCTPHSQKRLTADTLVDQRASMSTMNSNYSSRNQQYTPQLAYKQQQQQHDDYSADLLGISPSNTLIDATVLSMEDEKGRRQRVPSYQPQVVAMTEGADEGANNSIGSCYDYLYQSSYQEEQHVQQKREGDPRSA